MKIDMPELPWSDRPVWPGIDCGPGWWPLIAELDRDLRELDPDYRVVQVKEKFGVLCYYVEEGWRDDVAARINEAVRQSAEICEQCGRPGRPRDDRPWIRTLCDSDARMT